MQPIVEYEIGPSTPEHLRRALHDLLGAVEGDTVYLFEDGTVTMARAAWPDAARAIAPLLRSLPSPARRPETSRILASRRRTPARPPDLRVIRGGA